jgi:hypothetical protein
MDCNVTALAITGALVNPSADGGNEEFFELRPRSFFSSATRTISVAI